MAEFILKNMTADEEEFLIESAATSREEIGNDIYPPAKEKMLEKGIAFNRRKARQMTREDYEKFDYLIGMDDANVRNIERISGGDPEHKIYKILDFAGIDRSVADPWYTGDFQATYEDIVAGCRAFLHFLASGGKKIVSVQLMRDSDAYTIANITPSKELMYRAGKSIFDKVCWRSPVAIVAGKGNNAGDGYVVAKLLKENDVDCRIFLIDQNRFSEDGKYYFEECRSAGVPFEQYTEETDLSGYGCILDCLLGTGFAGEVKGLTRLAVEEINRRGEAGAYIVSADINSGLNGDTGDGTVFVKSDLTVSIGDYKYGHFMGKAAEAIKEKVNCDIGINLM